MNSICIIGISGYSGSGKTTLIRKILPELKKQGLVVGVLKHIHHKLNIDVRGKDTDHFYRAGADFVFAHDSQQGFARCRNRDMPLSDLIGRFPSALDLIIVEGHKDINIPGIWLETNSSGVKTGRSSSDNRLIVFRNDPEYHLKVLIHIQQELERFHSERLINAGLLIGGKSTRMGTPKALLKIKGRTLAARSFDILSAVSEKTVLLGSGQVPKSLYPADRLPDVPNVLGPLAGMLSAFRWAPDSAWIISSVDMPLMHKAAWEWLMNQRKPGIWAVLPKMRGTKGVETTGAVYEPMIFAHVESLAMEGTAKLQEIARHPKVITPLVPDALAYAWRNVNTLADWMKVPGADAL
jgi:molybdopterin-guanine dinucleotide biosynthesis protein MobB